MPGAGRAPVPPCPSAEGGRFLQSRGNGLSSEGAAAGTAGRGGAGLAAALGTPGRGSRRARGSGAVSHRAPASPAERGNPPTPGGFFFSFPRAVCGGAAPPVAFTREGTRRHLWSLAGAASARTQKTTSPQRSKREAASLLISAARSCPPGR